MNRSNKAPQWALTLILMAWSTSAAAGSSMTLGTAPGINHFDADTYLISGATINGGTPQASAFEAFHHHDANQDGAWNGPDARRRASGSYDNGLFGLYSLCESLGFFRSAHQYVRSRGILIIEDMVISTNDTNRPATIQTSVSFHVSGATTHFNYVASPELIQAELAMSIKINGTAFNGIYSWFDSSTGSSTTATGLGAQIASGGFADAFDATITTGLATVPVNTPFTLRVEFVVTASAGGGASNAYGGIVFDARNTAGFLPGTAIFNNLPAGYTANSQDVGIVNNAFDGTPVPVEPTTWGGIKASFGHDRR